MTRLPLALLLLAWALLSYHGGLHAWQALAAAALAAAALWAAPAPRLGRGESAVGLGLAVWLAAGLSWALLPQRHLNIAMALLLLWAVHAVARRQRAWDPRAASAMVLALGWAAAAAFLATGFIAARWHQGSDLSGPVLMPHLAARWIAPNQNILAGGLVAPAALLGISALAAGRWSALPGLLLALMAVVYAGSRGVYLALLVGSVWVLARSERRGRAALAVALCLGVTVGAAFKAPFSRLAHRFAEQSQAGKQDDNYFRRAEFWRGAASLSLKAPLLGHGLGSFEAAARQLDLPTPLNQRQPIARYRLTLEHAHNEWLESAVEGGWPLTLLVAGLCAAWFLRRARRREPDEQRLGLEAGLLSALALSLFDMNLRTPGLLWGLVMVAAALRPRWDGEGREAWTGRWAALLAVLLAAGAWAQVRSREADTGAWAEIAVWAQPLDSELHLQRLRREGSAPAWADWAGRHRSEWHLARARRSAEQGDWEGALQASARAIATRPYSVLAWFQQAEIQNRAGLPDLEARSVDRALELEPNFARGWAWRSDRALAVGDRKAALEALKKVHAIQTLVVSQEEPDAYTRFIQSIPATWLQERNKKLNLSTVFQRQS